MPTPSGKFIVGSAWHILRHRETANLEHNSIWTKGLPFKISLFLLRLWRGKVPTDDLWRRSGDQIVSKCWCCFPPQEETLQYIFLTSTTASQVWKYFLQTDGIVDNMLYIHRVIRAWWNSSCYSKRKPLFQTAPAIISWEI